MSGVAARGVLPWKSMHSWVPVAGSQIWQLPKPAMPHICGSTTP